MTPTEREAQAMSEQQLRRKIAAAKSYLSRLDKQRKNVLRFSQISGVSGIEEYNRLTEKRNEQYEKYRALCNQLPREQP